MHERDATAVRRPGELSPPQPTFRQMAREEFWFVAKGFFAPVYGTYLVWKQILRQKEKADRKALGSPPPQPPSHPAE